ncbi:hypothetical protein D9M69_722880 [compost metagenome]
MDRHAELTRSAGRVLLPIIYPAVALIKDCANIADLPWGGRAATKNNERDEKQNARHGETSLLLKIDKT